MLVSGPAATNSLIKRQLYERVTEVAPEFSASMSGRTWREVRLRINEVTGLSVGPFDSIEATSDAVVAALKVAKALGRIK